MTTATLLFWLVAILKVVLSTPIQVRAASAPSPENLSLARSQRKDDWLALAIMALVLLHDAQTGADNALLPASTSLAMPADPTLRVWLYLVCTLAMGWLVHRTVERLRRP